MAPTPRIPAELTRRPFSLEEARAAGLSPTALRGKSWRRLATGLYCWAGLRVDEWAVLAGWRRLLPREAAFAGPTAAWLHGLDLDPLHPVEVVVPSRSGLRSRHGVRVRRSDLATRDVAKVRGFRATTARRTLADLCLRLGDVEALALIDAALSLGRIDKSTATRDSCMRLRWLGSLAEPAESAMETRLRWVLLNAGLPPPEVQAELHDARGRFVGRADLFYPAARLAIEFDGANHRDRLVEDNRRQNLLLNAGFALLRFTAADVYNRPETIATEVRQALSRHGSAKDNPNARRSPEEGREVE